MSYTQIPPATFTDRVLLTTVTLAPQTTPFAPTVTSVVCTSRSIFCWTTVSQLTRGHPCTLVDHISRGGYTEGDDDCYPSLYWQATYGGLDRTFAYPGTACPSGFTPACTPTITLTNTNKVPPYTGTLTQTWCCPTAPGSNWACTDKSRDWGDPNSRLCVSLVTTSTEAWFTAFDPTKTDYDYSLTTSTVPPSLQMKVFRPAFPLGTPVPEVVRGLGPENEVTAISGGAIAGIVAGSVVGLVLVGLGVWLGLRRRRGRKAEERAVRQEEEEERNVEIKVPELATPRTMTAELPCSQPESRIAEMGGDERAVELSAYYSGTKQQ